MSAVREVSSLDLPSSSSSCRPMLSSALLIERRLTALIGQLGRGFGYRDSGLVNNPINLPTQGQIGTGAACRHAAHVRQDNADHFVRGADRFVQRDQLPLLLGNAEPDQFGLRPPENQRSPRRAVTASSRAASIAGRQRGPDRAESRHLAAGSRLRLRACRCRSGCKSRCRASADALTVAGLVDRGRETMVTVSAIVFVPVASRQDTPTAASARMVAGDGAVVHVDEREVCLI